MSDENENRNAEEDQNSMLDTDLNSLPTIEDKIEFINLLIGDSYNIAIAKKLEEFLDIQINENIYLFQANSTLLKLYQFNPTFLNKDAIAKMLAKSLMNFPCNDFLFLSYMIPSTLQKEEPLLKLFTLNSLLETCKFKEAWTHINNNPFFLNIPSFVDNVRNCKSISPPSPPPPPPPLLSYLLLIINIIFTFIK
ncbi:eukaryotic translation initiation factor 3 [Tieghemostelium lacteum]|uniref:Eukaryotic translation initiation factor 3 n=1 Tax=Tieghemostelium lacteum TaxID=361077 RepID=A0A151ZJ35_TIELA|nr:eukaryotic translation initiation factor 3 [Tieghemostelium lacteum]|eukprot:KYQ93927.1 eukaryotic translation initiation factor 3 [Tieghemostelium lacteum]